jgi:FAD:protein FMN transferase
LIATPAWPAAERRQRPPRHTQTTWEGQREHAPKDVQNLLVRKILAQPRQPWRVGLADPDRPGVLTETIDLVDRAVATSAGAGFRFDSKGRFTHLFDPATGRSPSLYSTVSVIAPTATEADALSTAFSLMPVSRIQDIVAVRPNVQARIVEAGGTLIVCGA